VTAAIANLARLDAQAERFEILLRLRIAADARLTGGAPGDHVRTSGFSSH
jgi:hypothetical protein